MKKKIFVYTCLAAVTVIALECGRKKSTDPVAVMLENAITQLKAAKDAKSATAVIEGLVAAIMPLKEKNPNIFNDRTNFKEADEEFIKVFTDAMVAHKDNAEFEAAINKLMPLGLLH